MRFRLRKLSLFHAGRMTGWFLMDTYLMVKVSMARLVKMIMVRDFVHYANF